MRTISLNFAMQNSILIFHCKYLKREIEVLMDLPGYDPNKHQLVLVFDNIHFFMCV